MAELTGPPIDQIEAFDQLLDALSDRGEGTDLSTRGFIESLASLGLMLAPSPDRQRSALAALDRMDEDA